MRPSTPAVALLLLAGCAGPGAAPAPPPDPGEPPSEVDRLRADLRSRDTDRALRAAKALDPECLSLDEIRAQADLLVSRPEEVLGPPEEKGCFRCPGGRSLGSPDVLRLLGAMAGREDFPVNEHSFQDLHRLTIQDHIPGLAALLEPATGETYRRILWMLRLLADNTDRHRDVVAGALLYARAAWVAETRGRSHPRLADGAFPGRDPPTAAAFLSRYAGVLDGEDPSELGLDEIFPRIWLERWEREAAPGGPAAEEAAGESNPHPEGPDGPGERRHWILEASAVRGALDIPGESTEVPGPEALRTRLEGLRADRERGAYWPATAGLAMAGDAAARAEFLAFLREDRIFVYDGCFDPVTFTLNGDPEALAHWRSRVGSNCCLWFFAEQALERWYPTMPRAASRVGDPDGTEEKVRAWWERNRDRLRWSRSAGGWVPAAE